MVLSRRERLREATLEEIKEVALRQMDEGGTAALSLREVAREMGMSAPALYNYYKNRDDLVTALIVDAYNSMGAALEDAAANYPSQEYGQRYLAAVMAYREWALAHRIEYMLIFGSPIPGYHAPREITIPVAQKAFLPLVAILQEAGQARKLRLPEDYEVKLTASMQQTLEDWAESYGQAEVSIPALHITLSGWGMIQGLVSLELYGHLDFLKDVGQFYQFEIEVYLKRLGLLPPD